MNIQAQDESFDAAYAIEATCHAPNKVRCAFCLYCSVRLTEPSLLRTTRFCV